MPVELVETELVETEHLGHHNVDVGNCSTALIPK